MSKLNELPDVLRDCVENKKDNLVDGYIRFIESENIEKISNILESSEIWNGGIPFATTVFGDILAWENGYIILYKFTEEDYTVILSGTKFFLQNLNDIEYQKDFFDIELYKSAVNKLGRIDNNQCYILEPIPRLGGAREEKYFNIGELQSYLRILM